ncbi:hypothetical protein BCV70DRAFT_159654 [Testicularia cyperi]|uniref:NudC domain-containing protein 1 n=1 Tax=Testicularia cyperi TaxID=1882483 RepID=A0A317XRX9_9BASI|nr:hypothetical protein BCV70DRAFT_159654 [Testicularia cyperi]
MTSSGPPRNPKPPTAASDANVLYGWTFHQSHDQATVLFLVPSTVSAKDVDVQIESDYIVAAVRGHPPVIKAKLYGRINTETSTWRIAERDKGRSSRRRSRSLTRSSSTAGSSQAAPSSVDRFRTNAARMPTSSPIDPSKDTPITATATSHSSLSASVTSLRSGSSYEVIPSSSTSQAHFSSANTNADWSSDSSEFGSSDSVAASLSQSAVLSEPGHVQSRRHEEREHILRRSRSSVDVTGAGNSGAETSLPSSSMRGPSPAAAPLAPKQGPPEVRLVTLHLDKVDSGIWPVLVVGPAPLHTESLPSRLRRIVSTNTATFAPSMSQSFILEQARRSREQKHGRRRRDMAQRQLNQALEEALSNFEGGDRMLATFRRELAGQRNTIEAGIGSESDDDLGPNASTLSINTIGSDESATVLGSRVTSLSGTSASLAHAQANATAPASQRWPDEDATTTDDDDEDAEIWKELENEARFNMDPTTLSLIGLQVSQRRPLSHTSGILRSLGTTTPSSIPEAFEHFARSWRAADICLATERLVHDFLPLLPVMSSLAMSPWTGLPTQLAEHANGLPATGQVISPALRECLASPTYASQRQRLVASLGGPKALGRLYVSYARLHLPSLAENRSPLAFPYGQLTSPFVSGRDSTLNRYGSIQHKTSVGKLGSTSSRTSSGTSSHGLASASGSPGVARSATAAPPSVSILSHGRSASGAPESPNCGGMFSEMASPYHSPPAEMPGGGEYPDFAFSTEQIGESQPGPLYFLLEACAMDDDISAQILESEWTEALQLALIDQHRRQSELEAIAQAEEIGSMAGDSDSGCLAFESDTDIRTGTSSIQSKRKHRSRASGRESSNAAKGIAGLFGFAWPSTSSQRGSSPTQTRRAYHDRRHHHPSSRRKLDDDTGILNFVSGAALLGVALAGSVAALGWWRRTGALNSSA